MAMEVKKKEANYVSGGSYFKKIGNIMFEVCIFFNNDQKVTAEDKIKRMIRNDVKAENF